MLLLQSSLKSFSTIVLSGIETALSYFCILILVHFIGQKNFVPFFGPSTFYGYQVTPVAQQSLSCFCSNFFSQHDLISNTDLMEFDLGRKTWIGCQGIISTGVFSCVALIRAKSYSIQLFSLSRLKSRIRTPVSVASESKCISLNLKIYLSEL